MTIQDFLAVDSLTLARLTDAQLREIATGGRKIANQRISRLKAAEMTNSPAYQALPAKVKKAGGFKTKGLNRTALLNQIKLEQQFVRGRTSTVKGWKATQEKAADQANKITGAARKPKYGYDEYGNLVLLKPNEKTKLTVKQVNRYWDLFHKVLQEDPKKAGSLGSAEIQRAIYDTIKAHPNTKNMDTLEKEISDRMKTIYENIQREKKRKARNIKRKKGGRRF